MRISFRFLTSGGADKCFATQNNVVALIGAGCSQTDPLSVHDDFQHFNCDGYRIPNGYRGFEFKILLNIDRSRTGELIYQYI